MILFRFQNLFSKKPLIGFPTAVFDPVKAIWGIV